MNGDKMSNNKAENHMAKKNISEEYINDFLEETNENIETIEINLQVLENEKENKDIIDSIFRGFHSIKGLAGFVSQDLIQKIAHQTESMLDKCRKEEQKVTDDLIKYILRSINFIKYICNDLKLNDNKSFTNEVHSHIYNFEYGNESNQLIKKKEISDASEEFENIIDSIIDNKDENEIKSNYKNSEESLKSIFVRIPMTKIDYLADMIGELLVYHSQFEQEASDIIKTNDKLNSTFYRINKLTKDIRNLSMSLRMVSLKTVFQKIERIGKDTIAQLNKNAKIMLSGEDTEIDRGVVEKLTDPLIHLIKNSIYHGIEEESIRVKKGKPPIGNVRIKAYSRRGNIYIEVSDDGKGIDANKVLQKAIEKNLVNPFIDYNEDEILDFVFFPGLSTIDRADSISGRGVGLDIVKTQITKLGGKVRIISKKGEGTSFIIKLPVNISLLNGIIADIAGSEYIIPTSSVLCTFKPNTEEWISLKGNESLIKFKDKMLPIINIDKILSIDNLNKEDCIFLELEYNGKVKALPVNRIIDKREIVVKPLGVDFKDIDYAYGASILGNGKVSIILDIENIFK